MLWAGEPVSPAPLDRRGLFKALAATAVFMAAGPLTPLPAEATSALGNWNTQTLEAFADTLIPGQRRYTGDLPIAGAVTGPGAVQAGAIQVLTSPQLPLAPWLAGIAGLLDARALAWAATHLLLLPPTWPAFVGLPFSHRTALVTGLFDPDDPDRPIWQVMALLVGLAFDAAGHQTTTTALANGHPGLAWIGFPAPDADGLWRFPQHSYNRPLADLHPRTTASGSPE
ncbi:DUF5987 family protein [Streptomyces sp. NBC_00233]|uniref:DUF5987 family protein n=1 Tax=Streptomyces sp. NBC_00233 TaxID=2975686 RepID=UPI0022568B81|nr:DUF5987 family protein [Streptomyces sp. NBC_00233]MCX5233249.1 DUF5987 family protein [Streptomyces sp. NBC_00233]